MYYKFEAENQVSYIMILGCCDEILNSQQFFNTECWAALFQNKLCKEARLIIEPVRQQLLWIGAIDNTTCNQANAKEYLNKLNDYCKEYPDSILKVYLIDDD